MGFSPSELKNKIAAKSLDRKFHYLFKKYKEFTLEPESYFVDTLMLCNQFRNTKGCIVECGVWRGGMSAGIAEILGNSRSYYLFDSFEGLPDAKEVDGPAALKWQSNKTSPNYFDNGKVDMSFAKKAMEMAGVNNYELIKGWFSESLPKFNPPDSIAILHLDGDWYESTMDCLTHLYPRVAVNGLIIIDDYYAWDGCTRAVHDYLSKNNLALRLHETTGGICYIKKTK